jgi:hypothetical protein
MLEKIFQISFLRKIEELKFKQIKKQKYGKEVYQLKK